MSASVDIIQKYSNAGVPSFSEAPNGVARENLRTYSEMSSISVHNPPDGGSVSGPSPDKPERTLYANEVSGYRQSTNKEESVQKSLLPISLNARAKIWMSRDLKVFPNSEYVYAISPIAIALFWGKGGLGIANSELFPTISAILTHFPNTTDTNNYFVRTPGRWFCLGTMLKWSVPLAPLDDFPENQKGRNPRLVSEALASPFRLSLLALALTTLLFKKMSRGHPGETRNCRL